MDFKNVGSVVNFDCPRDRTTYIHRIGIFPLTFIALFFSYVIVGRTGRAGQKGKAITFYSDKDMAVIRSISNVVRESGGAVPEWMGSLTRYTEYEQT